MFNELLPMVEHDNHADYNLRLKICIVIKEI